MTDYSPKKITVHYQVQIQPHHAGFGMFQVGEHHCSPDTAWSFFDDLVAEIDQNTFSLKKIDEALVDPEFIEAGIEDIRGRIYGEPPHIFAAITDYGELIYFGICSANVPENFFD